MKVKLIKTDPESYHMGHYFLNDENKLAIGSTDYEWCLRVCSIKPQYKLSKQNCDEIFGVVDVDKLAESEFENSGWTQSYPEHMKEDFIEIYDGGFEKAMELNKDKVFTLEDMKRAFKVGFSNGFASDIISQDKLPTEKENLFNEFIQSLQQPNEVDVEVEMEDIYIYEPGDSNIFGNYSKLPNPKAGLPKIDSEGCLILKKI
jgi:hypothetical protein